MNEYWKRIVDLERENFILRSQLTTKEFKIERLLEDIEALNTKEFKIERLIEDIEALKEKLKENEHDFRTLGQYYECSLQYQDELADIVEEKEDTVDELIDRLAKAGQQLSAAENKIKGYETEVSLLQQKLARAEGKLDKIDSYLRITTERGINL